MPVRLFLSLAALTLVVAGCDGTEPGGDAVAVDATLYQHGWPGSDSVVVANLSGEAVPVSLDGAWSMGGLEPATGYAISWGGTRPGPFVFIGEDCEGSADGLTFLPAASGDSEPFTRALPARPGATAVGPCTMYVFAIRDFGPSARVDLEIVRNDETYEIDLRDHILRGTPAFVATSADITFVGSPHYMLSSAITVEGSPSGLVPLEVYRMPPPGVSFWHVRAAGTGPLGDIYEGDPIGAFRYVVFLLDPGTGTAPPA